MKAQAVTIAKARVKAQVARALKARAKAKVVLAAQKARARVQVAPVHKDVHSLKVALHRVRKVAVMLKTVRKVKVADAAVPERVLGVNTEPV